MAAVEKLERDFTVWLGVAGGVTAGFGRSALRLAVESLCVEGGQVLVPNFICAQVPEAVRRAGGQPVFYPVRCDLTVQPGDFEAAFTRRTRAAIVAHYFGRLLPEIVPLVAICRERNVPLIEDCAAALGASAEGRPSGTFGDLAVFSFTKSEWCYGGGIVISKSAETLARLRALRVEEFRSWTQLSFCYGVLRRADFAANRPSRSRVAEHAGRRLERLSGLGGANFYDAGRFDAALPAFAARRARDLLRQLPAATARRRQILRQLTEALDSAGMLLRTELDSGEAGSFLLIVCPDGRAEQWVEQAARDGVTLRRCWPAYQAVEESQASAELGWLAEHAMVLEIHPQLAPGEIERIARTLRRLKR